VGVYHFQERTSWDYRKITQNNTQTERDLSANAIHNAVQSTVEKKDGGCTFYNNTL